jgi:diguanylate cyclase (GGDEF)-like protein
MFSSVFFLVIHDHLARKLRQQANFDSLTGIFNRRTLLRHAGRVLTRTQRRKEPLALLMIDADHFKQINDQFGHQAGDTVLRQIAALIVEAVRPGDTVGRYGGEEFCVVLARATWVEATQVAERIREKVLTTPILHAGESLRLTLSIGVADCMPGRDTVEDLIHDADQALFRAKGGGRNRVEMAGPPVAHPSNRLLAAEIQEAEQADI